MFQWDILRATSVGVDEPAGKSFSPESGDPGLCKGVMGPWWTDLLAEF